MTIEALNNAIAEFLGWKDISYRGQEWGWEGTTPEGNEMTAIPDYYNDLNAMYEAWKSLSATDKGQFITELFKITNAGLGEVYNATSQQRAIAFAKTIGKYVE